MRGELQCTGVSASWCPNHGDCVCPRTRPDGDFDGGNMNDPSCPLHSPSSQHPLDAVDLFDDHAIPVEPDEFEVRMGLVYCRRCGFPMAKEDGTILSKASEPCAPARIALRGDGPYPTASPAYPSVGG